MPFELSADSVHIGDEVVTVDIEGTRVGIGTIRAFRNTPAQDRRSLLLLEVPFTDRLRIASIRLYNEEEGAFLNVTQADSDTIICRCERVTKSEIVSLIQAGYRDLNTIKAAIRTGMGSCNGKNCTELILRLFREQGIDLKEVTPPIYRPPENEVPLSVFAGVKQ